MIKKIAVLLLVTIMALAVVSCSKKAETASGSVASTEAEVQASSRKDVEINVGGSTGWDTLSPFRSNIGNNIPVLTTVIFESLGYIDGTNTLVPWVAKEWKTDDNGVSYDITIYDYVVDSAGNKITSSDIVWFINSAKEKALKPNFKYVESAQVTGDYTLRVKFNNALVGVFEQFMTDVYVVSQAAYEKQGDDFVNSCISTTPYKCTSFVSGSTATFERRDDYWQDLSLLPAQLQPNVKKVTFHVIPEAAQLGIALETGVVDFAVQFTPSTAVQFEGDSEFTLHKGGSRNGMQIYFSGASEKVVANDKYLRQAICYAINNDLMISAILEGYGSQMHDTAPTAAIGYQQSWFNEEYYPYSVEKAKEALAKSNYKGEEIVLLGSSNMKTAAEIIQNCCAAVGINIKLNLMQVAMVTAIRLDGTQYDIFINQVGGFTMANHWNTRYDARAYKSGDATSRKDMVLADMIAKASKTEGFTSENINAVHEYIKNEAYGYGLYEPQTITVYKNSIGVKEVVLDSVQTVVPTACVF